MFYSTKNMVSVANETDDARLQSSVVGNSGISAEQGLLASLHEDDLSCECIWIQNRHMHLQASVLL